MDNDHDELAAVAAPAGAEQIQVRLMLAHAVHCPICADWLYRWRAENGLTPPQRPGGDPGE